MKSVKLQKQKVVDSLKKPRKDALMKLWKERWGKGTHIHHVKPINFEGTNDDNNLVPLKADKHVGGDGVHPQFWQPLKRFLMNIR